MNEARENALNIKYLLGECTEEESLQIEDRFFRSPEYHEQLLALEEELIHQYLSNELNPEQSARFEKHFLTTDRRRKKFNMTRDLMGYVSEVHPRSATKVVAVPGGFVRVKQFLQSLSSSMVWNSRFATAFLAVLLIHAAIFLYLQRRFQTTPKISRENRPSEVAASGLVSQPGSPEGIKTDLALDPAPQQSPKQETSPPAPMLKPRTTMGLVINFSMSRQAGEKSIELPVPSMVKQVRVDIPLEDSEYPLYKIIVKNTEGQDIVRTNGIRPFQSGSVSKISFLLPTERLKETDYVVNLYGLQKNGEEKLISEAFFLPKFRGRP